MIGLVLVSHSRALALAIEDLVRQMVGPDFPVAVAAGAGDDHAELGTDAVHIAEVLLPFCKGDGAVVLMDLGSAVLSAQTALELLDPDDVPDPAAKLRLCPAPIVEAAVAAAVAANGGADLDAITAEARAALLPKQDQLGAEEPAPAGAVVAASSSADALVFETVVDIPHGLHARPAAKLVQLVNGFRSEVRLANVSRGRGPSLARSLTNVALLQVQAGDAIRFTVEGGDAPAALAAIQALAARDFDDVPGGVPVPAPTETPAGTDGGTAVSEGIALGRPLALSALSPEPDETPAGPPAQELAGLERAIGQVRDELPQASGPAAEIMAAQALLLSDPVLLEAVAGRVRRTGCSAAAAWREEIGRLAQSYAALEDGYLRARAADLRDMGGRVLRALSGGGRSGPIRPEPPAILVADELLPSDAMACDPAAVLGILAKSGSPTAHAAIIVRSLGIPMVVDGSIDIGAAAAASVLAIDGATGQSWVEPDRDAIAEIDRRRKAFLGRRAAFEAAKTSPAVTTDGERIEVLANIGGAVDAKAARDNGAEGVGLFRTEFLYLDRRDEPDEEAQVEALAVVLANLGEGPVVIRTPDVGADKPLAFMPQPAEHNPFLGVRGIRLSLRHPDFFSSNLRSILRAGVGRDIWIMLPMVTTPAEMRQARDFVEAAHRSLLQAGIAHCWPVRFGMMVEVPAVATTLERFTDVADFFSIGSNDLTQYILAAERGNAALDALQDAAHPAVLRAVREICARAGGRHVSVCGDAASDPLTSLLLIGAGVRSLSVRPNQVGAIKAGIRGRSVAALARLADEAMGCDDAAGVRELAGRELRG